MFISDAKQVRHTVMVTLRYLLFTVALALASFAPNQALAQVAPSPQITELMTQGRALLEKGTLDEAYQRFEEVLKIEPNHVEAHYRLGSIHWQRNEVAKAFEYFNKSVELAPTNVSLRMSLAGFYEQARLLDEAIKQYRQVIALKSDSPEAKDAEKRLDLALVKNYVTSGDIDSALQLLNALVDEYPDDPRVLQHLGFAYSMANRLADSERVYQRVLRMTPTDDSAHLNVSGIYERLGDSERATFHLRRVIEIAPGSQRAKEAQIRLNLIAANQLQQFGDLQGALEEIKKTLDTDPKNPLANSQVAVIYHLMGQYDLAEKALKIVLEVVPNNIDARTKLGSLYVLKNNYIDAISELETVVAQGKNTFQGEQAAKILADLAQKLGPQMENLRQAATSKNEFLRALNSDPSNVEAHFNLGIIYTRQGLLNDAKQQFEAVVKLDPGIARAHLALAQIYTDLGDYAHAVDAFNAYFGLNADPANDDRLTEPYLTVVGQKLFTENKEDAATSTFEALLARNPESAPAYFYLGLIKARSGAFDKAVFNYKEVLKRVPSHVGARINYALVLEQLGREEEALDEYRQVQQASPPGNIRTSAEQRITNIQRAINGFSSNLSYNMSFDNNANLSDANPSAELRSDLTGTLNYRYKYSSLIRSGAAFSPTYVIYHRGQSDFLNLTFNPFVVIGESQQNNVTISYSANRLSSVLNNQNVSHSRSLYVEGARRYNKSIMHRLRLSVSDSVSEGDDRTVALDTGGQYLVLLKATRFDATNYSLRLSGDQSLENGYSTNYSYTYANNVNKHDEGGDYAFNGHTFSGGVNKFLSTNLSGSLNASFAGYFYKFPDTVYKDKRRNLSPGLTLSFNYRINDSIRASTSYSFQRNNSNLATAGNFINAEERRLHEQGASLGSYSKDTVSIGLAVNF